MLKKAFDFFIFTSLFIACCAVLMVYQAFLLFGGTFSLPLFFFVFFGSVCSYNFHWYLTPPQVKPISEKLRWNLSNRNLHLALFLTGLIGAAICAILLIEYWLWLGLTAFFTFLYSAPMIRKPFFMRLRKIAVGKTIYLALAWAHVTALLPLLIALPALTPVHVWYVLNRFFFLYAICIVFDRRDVESDRKAGIKSLITWLSAKGIDKLFWIIQLAVLVTGLVLFNWLPLLSVLILLFPAVILALLYNASRQNRSDYLYYFLLDGLMALSAAILILAKFVT